MQFYHPEILYGLFALIIPIIVHLFQLRKFKTEPFTNVALLKKLVISSRKSSKLKKWLSLITRLLIMTCLVLAFAQPYFKTSKIVKQNKQIGVFIDNSFSMALKGQNASLFDQSKEELLKFIPENENYHIATHNEVLKNINTNEFKTWLYDLNFSPISLELKAILNKTQSLYPAKPNQQNEIVILSDFQNLKSFDTSNLKNNYNYHFIKYQPKPQTNFSIDTAFIKTSIEQKTLIFKVSASEITSHSLPVSLYDDKTLLGKFSLNFKNEKQKTHSFDIEQNEILNGRIQIDDASLNFDNTLYFSIDRPEKIKVLVISDQASLYLDKIFNNQRFDYQQRLINNLEYAEISEADVLILNELQSIPQSLNVSIENFVNNNNVLGIVPAKTINLNTYNELFGILNLKPYSQVNSNAIKLTTILFEHPIFENVFTEKVQNFDYPTFNSYYQSSNPQKALALSNGSAFLESHNKIYRFNAAIEDNSNFKQSPLVVLSFYNLALQAQNTTQLYAKIGEVYKLDIKTQINSDEVLSLSQEDYKFIPRQTLKGQNITLEFVDNPKTPGHYALVNPQNDTISQLAFNASRIENKLKYLDLSNFDNVHTYDSFSTYAKKISSTQNTKSLWQWFITFALIFMIIELLLLRFIK